MMLERPDSGTVTFDGIDPFTLRGKDLLKFRRRVQMVFQDPVRVAELADDARATSSPSRGAPTRRCTQTKTDRDTRVRELLDLVGLGAKAADKYPQEFSGGQRQRIGIARALALNPDVIICDEPVSALDLSVQAQVLNLLNDLQQQLGISYVFISHDLSVVRHVADRVAVMYLGPHRRIRAHRSGLRLAEPSVHRGADVGGTQARRRQRERTDPAQGRGAVAAESAVGMPLPDPVLEGDRRLRRRTAAAGASTRRSAEPRRGVPPPHGGRAPRLSHSA